MAYPVRLLAHVCLCVGFSDAGNDEPLHALTRPASEKRQGTKSREVWYRLGSESYGDFTSAPTSMVDVALAGCELRRCRQARS
jgi:hypothetical protein